MHRPLARDAAPPVPRSRSGRHAGTLTRASRRTTVRALVFALICSALGSTAAPAQQHRATLSLDEAITLALRHNPDYQARRAAETDADWAVREAYGALLPGAGASMGLQYQASGQPRFGALTGGDLGVQELPAYYLSDYYLGLSYQLGAATVYRPGQARSEREATLAGIDAARSALVADVTRQYLSVLRSADARDLAERELERASEHLRLAEARAAVGAVSLLDARQAELERGRAEVALLQASNDVEVDGLRLMERLGIDIDADIELVTAFDVADLPWTSEELVSRALSAHPRLQSLRATGQASDAAVRMARGAYLPTLELTAGISGFARQSGNTGFLVSEARRQARQQIESCELLNQISAGLSEPLSGMPTDCSLLRFTDAAERDLLRQNDVFPFSFSSQPLTARLQISLPVFQGFTRRRRVEQARLAATETQQQLRAEELRVRADVTATHMNVTTARRTVELERRNVELAADQLRLARERYELGSGTFLELMEAQTMKARADRSLLVAVYAFHEGLAALEAAVGQPLAGEGR